MRNRDVLEIGSGVRQIRPRDRVVAPFQISWAVLDVRTLLYTQCETTQVRREGSGAALFGYSKLYGQVPGGRAQYLRVPQAQFTHILVPHGPPDDRFITSLTSCRQPGRRWNTQACRTVAHC